jgi:phosphoribosylformylglycinamidine cyclo-ligase
MSVDPSAPAAAPAGPWSYQRAGVDLRAAALVKERIKVLARRTFSPAVLSELGAFGGLFRLDPNLAQDPVLVASADGVGSKLKVAMLAGRHDTVGCDLVHHCVNDVLTQGAMPLFFLDYLAVSKMDPSLVEEIIEGISRGCSINGCALLGGETAEMPDLYAAGEYDLAGFLVGLADRSKLLSGAAARPGDVLLGLASDGLHTNGYTLARKVLFEAAGLGPDSELPELGESVASALLRPHRSYLRALAPLLGDGRLRALAHITGGGIPGNLPRVLPNGTRALIQLGSWEQPPLFGLLQRLGNVGEDDMRRTFNLGIGMIAVVAAGAHEAVQAELKARGEQVWAIGELTAGAPGVEFVY